MEGANHTWSGGRDGRGVWEVRRRCWRLARQGTIHWQVTSNTGREGGQKGADFLACTRVCASGCKQGQRQALIGKGSRCRVAYHGMCLACGEALTNGSRATVGVSRKLIT